MKYLIVLTLVAVLAACTSSGSLVSYEVLRPAKYTIAPEIKSVVLINNSLVYDRKDVHVAEIDGETQVIDTMIYAGYPDSLLLSLEYSLMQKSFFDTVYLDTTHYKTELKGNPIGKLSQQVIDSVSKKYDADAVLSLEAYVYGTKVDVKKSPDMYYSTMGVHGYNYWRMYDCQTSNVLLEDLQADTIYWYGDGPSLDLSLLGFPTVVDANAEFAFYMGDEFSRKIVPEWEVIERQLYVEGNGYFVAANDWLGKNNPEEARKLWGYVYENGKDIDKCRAAHNIAVTLEREGDIDNALVWAYKSYELYKLMTKENRKLEVQDATNYYVYLTHRKKEIEKLDKQVGGA
nr:DUF6340 family protein [uncultured Carboxylicivirga sp.]